MRDYAYYIPGYTGFCPYLRDHFGHTYGKATRHILKEQPFLKERLSAVHYHGQRGKIGLPKTYKGYEEPERDNGRWEPTSIYRDKYNKDGDRHGRTGYSRCIKDREQGDGNLRYDYDSQGFRTDRKAKKDWGRCFHTYRDEGRNVEKAFDTYRGDCRNVEKAFGTYCGDVRNVEKDFGTYRGDGRTVEKDFDCRCPRYFCITEFTEHVPESHIPKDRGDYHVHYPTFPDDPCHRVLEGSCAIKAEKSNYQPQLKRKPRIMPARCGGVIPKYTGHIPGMHAVFGERYGIASDRLLHRHRDNMAKLNRHPCK